MVTFVETRWVAERIHDPEFLLLDARRPMKYMQGHLKNAVNLPSYKAFDQEGRLLPADELAAYIGSSGLDDRKIPVLYDSPQGQTASMLAWILKYLGRNDVHLMNTFFEGWVEEGREIFYRPIESSPAVFTPQPNPSVRITADETKATDSAKRIDFRSVEEFTGEKGSNENPGHLPGAVNLPWSQLNGANHRYLASEDSIEQILRKTGIKRSDSLIAYCQSGPRASLGYLALNQMGYGIQLFDGSYQEWGRREFPVEG